MEQFKNTMKNVWHKVHYVVTRRVFAGVLMCAVTLSLAFGISVNSHVVTVNDGDDSRVVVTMRDDPYQVLSDAGVSLDVHDAVSVNADDAVIEVDRAVVVEVQADGLSTLVHMTEGTVADALEKADVTVGELDRVSYKQKTPIEEGMLIQVDRVAYEEYTVKETIPYETKYRYTAVLQPGVTKLDKEGANGQRTLTYRKVIVNGEVTETKVIKAMEVGESHPTCACPSLKIYVAERETLLHLVERSSANGYHHFGRDLIQRNIKDGTLKICGYEYKGYCCQIDSIQAYFNFNQTVMTEKVRKALFPAEYPVYTKVRDDMPARYNNEGKASNSLIGNGCIIEGTVINSVLFRGVKVAKGAVVKNSIIMQDAQIQEGAEIDHCILDKQSVIRRNGRLIAPAAYPIVIAKNVVI